MNIRPEKAIVRKPSDIVVGQYYWIRGTDSWGLPMPPQVCRVTSAPRQHTLVGIPYVEAEVMVKIADRLIRYNTHIDLWQVNAKPNGKAFTTGHGYHDREMVRITHPAELKAFLGDEGYRDIQQQAKKYRKTKKPEIIPVSKYGTWQ